MSKQGRRVLIGLNELTGSIQNKSTALMILCGIDLAIKEPEEARKLVDLLVREGTILCLPDGEALQWFDHLDELSGWRSMIDGS